MSKRFTKKEILEAINKSGGVILNISRKLGCDWHTADKYIQMWEITKRALRDEKEKMLDTCEITIANSIVEGNTQDAKWYLAKKGKDRGYGDDLTLLGDKDKPLKIKVNLNNIENESG